MRPCAALVAAAVAFPSTIAHVCHTTNADGSKVRYALAQTFTKILQSYYCADVCSRHIPLASPLPQVAESCIADHDHFHFHIASCTCSDGSAPQSLCIDGEQTALELSR